MDDDDTTAGNAAPTGSWRPRGELCDGRRGHASSGSVLLYQGVCDLWDSIMSTEAWLAGHPGRASPIPFSRAATREAAPGPRRWTAGREGSNCEGEHVHIPFS